MLFKAEPMFLNYLFEDFCFKCFESGLLIVVRLMFGSYLQHNLNSKKMYESASNVNKNRMQ